MVVFNTALSGSLNSFAAVHALSAKQSILDRPYDSTAERQLQVIVRDAETKL